MTNSELIKAIRDEDKSLGEHAMLSARIIHNATVTMQTAYIEATEGKGDSVAVAWIENLLIDSDNIPQEGYGGAGDLTNAHDPDLYFRDNRLDGDLSPYQSRLAPLIDDLERRMDSLQKSMDLMTAERDHWKANHDYRVHAAKLLIDRPDCPLERVKAYKRHVELIADVESYVSINTELATELAKLREQEPVAFWWIGPDGKDNGGPYSGKPSEAAIDSARNMGCEAHLLYAEPIPAPDSNLVESHQIKAPEGMILMPVKADERLVAGFVGCETREEAMLGWDVAVRMQEVRTGKRKPADPIPFYEAEVIRLQKELADTRYELGKVRYRIADRIKAIETPVEVKNTTCPACEDDSLLAGRPSRAKNLPNNGKYSGV